MSGNELGAGVVGLLFGIILMGGAGRLDDAVGRKRFADKIRACKFAGYDTAMRDYDGVTYCAHEESLVLYEVEGR